MPGSVIVSGRAPIGKLNGALASVAPVDLGGDGRIGAAALCGGGGQGDAVVLTSFRS